MDTTILAAAAPSATGIGAGVLLLMLGTGIFVGIKSKKLTITELLICGMFGGLLFTSTALGGPLQNMTGALGGWVIGMVS